MEHVFLFLWGVVELFLILIESTLFVTKRRYLEFHTAHQKKSPCPLDARSQAVCICMLWRPLEKPGNPNPTRSVDADFTRQALLTEKVRCASFDGFSSTLFKSVKG